MMPIGRPPAAGPGLGLPTAQGGPSPNNPPGMTPGYPPPVPANGPPRMTPGYPADSFGLGPGIQPPPPSPANHPPGMTPGTQPPPPTPANHPPGLRPGLPTAQGGPSPDNFLTSRGASSGIRGPAPSTLPWNMSGRTSASNDFGTDMAGVPTFANGAPNFSSLINYPTGPIPTKTADTDAAAQSAGQPPQNRLPRVPNWASDMLRLRAAAGRGRTPRGY